MVEENKQYHIDPVQFGELIGSVTALNKSVRDLTVDVISLKEKLNTGRGFALGMMVTVAAMGGAAGAFAHKILENIK